MFHISKIDVFSSQNRKIREVSEVDFWYDGGDGDIFNNFLCLFWYVCWAHIFFFRQILIIGLMTFIQTWRQSAKSGTKK